MFDDDESPVHDAVEMEDLPRLYEVLRAGADPNEEQHGLTLLHHAIDVEVQGHIQNDRPLHVDTTALLLAMGADPRRRSRGGTGVSAEQFASADGHWLACVLIEAWLKQHDG